MKHCVINMYADNTSLMLASYSITHINDCVNGDLSNLNFGYKLINCLSMLLGHSLVIGSRKRLKDISDDKEA